MSAWGPAIFSDDLASDIRTEYRELLEDQVPDDEATRRIVASYAHLDSDEEHILWLALAATQWRLGRLDADVRARALEVIDTGRGLHLWELEGPQHLKKRKAALAALRAQLTAEQPQRRPVRRPWAESTDLQPGDVLGHTAEDNHLALLRVCHIDESRYGNAPVLEHLDWTGTKAPATWRLRRLKVRTLTWSLAGGPEQHRPAVYRVARHRRKDPDWADVGFVRLAKAQPSPAATKQWSYTVWAHMPALIHNRS